MAVRTFSPQTISAREHSRLHLPEGAALYLAGGVPHMFRRVDSGAEPVGEDWLYIPELFLEEILAGAKSARLKRSSRVKPITLDEGGDLFPLVLAGRVRGFIADFSTSQRGCAAKIFRTTLDWLRQQEVEFLTRQTARPPDFTMLLQTIESSAERVVRSALGLLVEQVPSGLAAIYEETSGIYRLCTAVGNIAMWDLLDGELPHASAARWLETIERKRPFLPVGFLPERPMLLNDPAVFLFVHDGPRSSQARRLIAMPIPGDISRSAAAHLLGVAQAIASLDENRMGVADDAFSLSSEFHAACEHKPTFDEFLSRVFTLLSRRIGLSRLLFIDAGNRGAAAVKRAHAEPTLRKEFPPSLALAVRSAADEGRMFLPDLAQAGILHEEEAKRYYLDNVKSEACFHKGAHGEGEAWVAFGLPETGPALKRFERLLDSAAGFLHLYHRFVRPSSPVERTAADSANPTEILAERRLRTTATLTDGHFHTIFDSMAGLLGKSEVSDQIGVVYPPGQNRSDLLGRMVRHLEQIRHIVGRAASDHSATLPVARILADLPAQVEGFIHHLQDTKNIAVTVTPVRSAVQPFAVPVLDFYDRFLPVLLALMGEAICSGEIRVRAAGSAGESGLEIECASALIAHTNIIQVIQSVVEASGELDRASGDILVPVGPYVWSCSPEGSDPECARLIARTAVTDKQDVRDSARGSEVR